MTFVVLVPGHTALGGPLVFPSFPGIYNPGEPVDLEDIGITEEQAREIITRDRLPLDLIGSERRTVADIKASLEGASLGDLTTALTLEQAEDNPRTTLVGWLNDRIAEAEAADAAPDFAPGDGIIPATMPPPEEGTIDTPGETPGQEA